MSWERAAPLADLAEHPVLFKKSPLQIAIFKVGENVFAIDNRCPHEGYPLVQGTVDSNCVLTCNWHNWKFRLQDGQCILGGDNVRHYPVKVDDGQVWIDATELPADELQAAILGGLQTAFERRDCPHLSRNLSAALQQTRPASRRRKGDRMVA